MKKNNNESRNDNLIKNYGLFWKIENVFWGKPRNPGNLLGIGAKNKSADFVDFREQTGIYILYADYKIVYIGQAGKGKSKLFARLKDHMRDELAGRWNQFSWFGLLSVLTTSKLSSSKQTHQHSTNIVLNHFEAILIVQYLQHRDENNLGKSDSEVINEILNRIKSHKQG